jgi:hypothetical protein
MKRKYIAFFIAAMQLLLALILLKIGRQQKPLVLQDYPPYVGPAIKLSQAINAPATALEGGLVWLVHQIGINPGSYRNIWNGFYFIAVFLLWLLVGLEVRHKFTTFLRRPLWAGSILAVGFLFAILAVIIWQLNETIIAVGFGAWSIALIAVYGSRLIRFSACVSSGERGLV